MKASKPGERPKSKKKKKPKKPGPSDVSKRYSLPLSVVEEIRKAAADYRPQGRALQVATELLVRNRRAISTKGHSSMRIPRSHSLAVLVLNVLFLPLPGHAQSSMCAPVSNNPLVMASLCSPAPQPANVPAISKTTQAYPMQSSLTLTAQQVNSWTLHNAPMIQVGDALLMESNRGDFDLEIRLSDGNAIRTGPHAASTAVGWRGGRVQLDYPGAINKRIVRMKATLLHDGGTPLLFRGIKLEREGRLIVALDERPPEQHQADSPIEPPMSYPSESFAPHPHLMNASVSKPDLWHPQPELAFLASKFPSLSMQPMMLQSTTSSGDPNRYKFNGKELDTETGLYNYGARYYSPALGRFMSPDWSAKPVPIPYANLKDPQTLNLYAYVRNNPTSLPDPDGHAIQLSDNEEQRKQQLAAAQQAVGKQAGKYLYDNTGKNGHHYIGIYTKGPDGKGAQFNSLNGAANKLNSIIQDSRIAFVATVSPGTNVSPNLSTDGLIGTVGTGTPGASRPINQQGGNEVLYMTSGDPGKLPADFSSSNRDAPLTPGDIFSHEIGHILARWFGGDSNRSSVQMENDTRRLNGEPTRNGHDAPHDLPQ